MLLEKVNLFDTKKDFLLFLLISLFVLSYTLLIEYNNFKTLTRFDSSIINATVIKQYEKTKLSKKNRLKTYQVLKLKSNQDITFYTSAKNSFPNSIGKSLELEIWAGKITFYEYMTSFYAYSKVINIKNTLSLITVPISGFHLGVLATVLFFIFKLPYKYLQNRYFPYRSYKIDSFIFISVVLFGYLLFLDSPPSLLRAFTMLLIGFILYDRSYKIISMQTLFLTAIILISFFPRLFFALGFWLSIAGVFYIFLFLVHYKHISKTWQFILVPFWVYFMMLPYSLVIFSSFSIYHPLSIIWTTLFTLFYPLSILFHIIGYGDIFDSLLKSFISLGTIKNEILFNMKWLLVFAALSILSIYKRFLTWVLLLTSISMSIYSIYQIT